MRQTIFTKKPEATLEENMNYALNKIDYLLRKVGNYDRALNEFAQIKSTIDEAAQNTRSSKDIVRETKSSIDIHSNDISSLSKLISSVSERFEDQFHYLKEKTYVLSERVGIHHEESVREFCILREEIQDDLNSFLDTSDLADIKNAMSQDKRVLEMCISNAHENNLILEARVKQLEKECRDLRDDNLLVRKDLCRLQNALVRKGVPVDIQ